MTIAFRIGEIVVGSNVDTLTIGLGRKFRIQLGDVQHGSRIHWTTDNDPVLDLRESADKMMARVTATEIGVSNVYINEAQASRRVRITVVPMNDTTGEAVKLNGTIGPETKD